MNKTSKTNMNDEAKTNRGSEAQELLPLVMPPQPPSPSKSPSSKDKATCAPKIAEDLPKKKAASAKRMCTKMPSAAVGAVAIPASSKSEPGALKSRAAMRSAARAERKLDGAGNAVDAKPSTVDAKPSTEDTKSLSSKETEADDLFQTKASAERTGNEMPPAAVGAVAMPASSKSKPSSLKSRADMRSTARAERRLHGAGKGGKPVDAKQYASATQGAMADEEVLDDSKSFSSSSRDNWSSSSAEDQDSHLDTPDGLERAVSEKALAVEAMLVEEGEAFDRKEVEEEIRKEYLENTVVAEAAPLQDDGRRSNRFWLCCALAALIAIVTISVTAGNGEPEIIEPSAAPSAAPSDMPSSYPTIDRDDLKDDFPLYLGDEPLEQNTAMLKFQTPASGCGPDFLGLRYNYLARVTGPVTLVLCGLKARFVVDGRRTLGYRRSDAGGCKGSGISWEAEEGRTYEIEVDFPIALTRSLDNAERYKFDFLNYTIGLYDNDDCKNSYGPIRPTPNGVLTNYTTRQASNDSNFNGTCRVASAIADAGAGVWYFVNGTGEPITASTCSSRTNFPTQISVFSGVGCGDLVCINGNDDANEDSCAEGGSRITWASEEGQFYHVLVQGADPEDEGEFQLELSTDAVRPENDFCSRRLPMPDPWQTASIQLIRSAQDSVPLCSSPATNANATEYVPFAVWYEVQGTGRRYLFDISSDDDASLEVRVFTGACNALVCVEGVRVGNETGIERCPDCRSDGRDFAVEFPTLANQTYYVLIGASDLESSNVQHELRVYDTKLDEFPDCQERVLAASCPNYSIQQTFADGICDSGSYNVEVCAYDGGDCIGFPGCAVEDPSRIGDGRCDGGAYNTEACGYDGGDCVGFNNQFPGCVVEDPWRIGDDECDFGSYNTEACAFDGFDCFLNNNPGCDVKRPFYLTDPDIGDGTCDGAKYNTEACAFDGGDCVEFNNQYPDCNVSYPSYIGDGECDGAKYNTEACAFDGGDCVEFNNQYPGCDARFPDWLGNGVCDGGDFNTEACAFDGGDCLAFNDQYPDCDVYTTPLIGDGICDGGAYNTEACGFDGGDCVALNNQYPDCEVENPNWIGDGVCDGGDYNTEACAFDGGDCVAFNNQYPDCDVEVTARLGNGICDGGAYNTEACEYDIGDCIKDNLFPECEYSLAIGGDYWIFIGDGICDETFDNEECGYDAGDCF